MVTVGFIPERRVYGSCYSLSIRDGLRFVGHPTIGEQQ